MQVSIDLGHIALLGVQIIGLFITFFIHSRQLSALDIEKRDRGAFAQRVSDAVRVANEALQGVTHINITHYESLAKKHAIMTQELETLKAECEALREMLKSLSNRVAARVRFDAAEHREAQSVRVEAPIKSSANDRDIEILEELKAQGLVTPLSVAQPPPQPQPPNAFAFGKVVKREGT